jgi:glycosyltransferase involved in cell wall biosynthesis
MRIVHLYRPQLPQLRAQAIQVLHTCHALARRGHEVRLFATHREGQADPAALLEPYGLEPHPSLALTLLPWRHPGLSGLDFRLRVLRLATGSRRERTVLYARTKRHAAELAPWRRTLGCSLVFEAHEVESAQARERGEPHEAIARLEERVLTGCDGLVTNCEGTLELLEEVHGSRLPGARRVIHNGTDPGRRCDPLPHEGTVVGYLGSLRSYKNIHTVIEAAELLPAGFSVELVGGEEGGEELARARALVGARARVSPALPYGEVPALLARLDVLLVSMGDDLYGRRLASPLKLWDYLATGTPIAAPDLPSIRGICGDGFAPYTPGDAASLARAVERAAAAGRVAPRLRSWDDRASELEAFLGELP